MELLGLLRNVLIFDGCWLGWLRLDQSSTPIWLISGVHT